jgi:hypothetical protein
VFIFFKLLGACALLLLFLMRRATKQFIFSQNIFG